MERVEGGKSGEGPAKKRENLGEKLMRVGKRGGQVTPVASFWRPNELKHLLAAPPPHNSGGRDQELLDNFEGNPPCQIPCVSARKLAATLWELHHYKLPLNKMHHSRLRTLNHQHQENHPQAVYKEKGGLQSSDPSHGLPDMPGSSSSLKRHVAATLMQHHRLERSRQHHDMQPVSPSSYGSSMEIATYNPAMTPTSSIELKGRFGETSYSLKTSTELLKVLNRIWNLEEQHVTNVSLVKALKKELDHARSRIKNLVREQQSDRREMDELVKQIAEGKLVRKNKEQDRINATIQSMRDEVEDERKLRKRSEGLHRKLARELYEVKTTLAGVSKDLEKELKSRNLLENLCDEFARGIRVYEKEVHTLRQESDKDWDERGDHDQLVLHVSESWLDERVQIKLEHGHGLGEKQSAVDKLSCEIEALIQMRQNDIQKINEIQVSRDPRHRRSSLESIPLNLAVSAPRDEDDEDNSPGSDSNCFELGKISDSNVKSQENEYPTNHGDETQKQSQAKKNPGFTMSLSPSSFQVEFEEQMAQAVPNREIKPRVENAEQLKAAHVNSVEAGKVNSSEKYESEGRLTGLNSNHMMNNLIRNHYSLSGSTNMQPDKEYGLVASSAWRSHPSPVRRWTDKLPSHDFNISEPCSNFPPKENALKAKLLETKTRSQRPQSRVKASIIPSVSK